MVESNRTQGFSFIELTVVLAISSSLLLMVASTSSFLQQKRLVNVMANDLQNLKTAIYSAELAGINALSAAELQAQKFYFGELISPWGEAYQVEYRDTEIIVRGNAGGAARAAGVARLLPASHAQGPWVEMYAGRVIAENSADLYLHRTVVEQAPELNAMATDLWMQNNNIENVNQINAITLASEYVTADYADVIEINSEQLLTEWLYSIDMVADNAFINELISGSVAIDNAQINHLQVNEFTFLGTQLQIDNLHAANFFTQQLEAAVITTDNVTVSGELQAEQALLTEVIATTASFNNAEALQLIANEIIVEQMQAEQLTVKHLQSVNLAVSHHLITDTLTANQITAADFITPTGSLSQLQTMMSSYQQLWDNCVAAHSCE